MKTNSITLAKKGEESTSSLLKLVQENMIRHNKVLEWKGSIGQMKRYIAAHIHKTPENKIYFAQSTFRQLESLYEQFDKLSQECIYQQIHFRKISRVDGKTQAFHDQIKKTLNNTVRKAKLVQRDFDQWKMSIG